MASHGETCCDLGLVEAPVDYSVSLGNARPFLERAGILPAYRNPTPRVEPAAWRVHAIPLAKPLPLPGLQGFLDGSPPPDRGRAHDWPHPDLAQEE